MVGPGRALQYVPSSIPVCLKYNNASVDPLCHDSNERCEMTYTSVEYPRLDRSSPSINDGITTSLEKFARAFLLNSRNRYRSSPMTNRDDDALISRATRDARYFSTREKSREIDFTRAAERAGGIDGNR